MAEQTQVPGKLHTGPYYQCGTIIVTTISAGPDPAWQDGDVRKAISWGRTLLFHAEGLCNLRHMAGGVGVRRPLAEFGRDAWFEQVYEFRFERLTETTYKRVRLSDLTEDTFGLENGDIRDYIARRLKHPNHRIFGTPGAEIWHGGKRDFSDTASDKVWQSLEANTAHLKTDFDFFPVGSHDLGRHLTVTVQDLTQTDIQELEEQETELQGEETVVLKQRKRTFNWKAINGMNTAKIAQAQSRNLVVDLRDIKQPVSLYKSVKV